MLNVSMIEIYRGGGRSWQLLFNWLRCLFAFGVSLPFSLRTSVVRVVIQVQMDMETHPRSP